MQTGPAVRGDQNILAMHQDLLAQANQDDLKQVYQLLSDGIVKRHHWTKACLKLRFAVIAPF